MTTIPSEKRDITKEFKDLSCKHLGTDQPGRVLAVFVFAPILMYKAYAYKDKFIAVFAILLFLWDLFWLTQNGSHRMALRTIPRTKYQIVSRHHDLISHSV